jgi:tetratricopeptide (TPR) repeat protein
MAGADNALRAALADLYIGSGDLKRNMGDGKGCFEDASHGLSIYREIEASGSTTPAMLQSLATAYAAVGMGESKMGRLQDALAHFRDGAAQMEKLVEADPHNTSLRRDLMVAYGHIGDVVGNPNLENLGDRDAALRAYRQAAEIGKSLHDDDPANEQASADYAIALSRVATVMDDSNFADKIDVERESLRVLNQGSRVSPGNLSLRMYQAYVNLLLGDTLKIKGDVAAAENAYQEAASISDSGRSSGQISFVTTFVNANVKLAQLSATRGGRAPALEFAQRALDASTRLPAGAVSPFAEPRGQAAMGLTYAALAHGSGGRPGDREQAISWLHKSMDGWHRVETLPGFSAPHRREMREVNDTLAALKKGTLR